jgi:hypothetical protein
MERSAKALSVGHDCLCRKEKALALSLRLAMRDAELVRVIRVSVLFKECADAGTDSGLGALSIPAFLRLGGPAYRTG